jgi:hypothetical protein
MTDLPERVPDLISVAELSQKAGVTRTYYYAEVRAGRAVRPLKAGVPLKDAQAWLEARAAKAAERAARWAGAAKEIRHADETT